MFSFLRNDSNREILRLSFTEGSPEIASTFIMAPQKVLRLRWGTIAAAARDMEEMREVVWHRVDFELFPSGGVEARQVHVFIAKTSGPSTLRSCMLSKDMVLSASGSICPQNRKAM